MSFYSQIAEHYHYIFPLSQGQMSFILARSPQSLQMKLLEVGCGIGELSMELSKHFHRVSGIDLDETMIQKAKEQAQDLFPQLTFNVLNMLHLDQLYQPAAFDRIVCFGNTLVHLLEDHDILRFFEQCRKVLHENGRLMLQILNYDKILDQRIKQLPIIENDIIRFERSYEFGSDQALIEFHTKLLIKKNNLIYTNAIPLHPIRQKKIEELLSQAGFRHALFFGSYEQDLFQKDSELLLCEAI
jgi:glycine/sarcosine N-methyltransferase